MLPAGDLQDQADDLGGIEFAAEVLAKIAVDALIQADGRVTSRVAFGRGGDVVQPFLGRRGVSHDL
jgi:hypothetical protein